MMVKLLEILSLSSYFLFAALLPTTVIASVANICDSSNQGTNFNPNEDACDIYVLDPSFSPMLLGRSVNTSIGIKARFEVPMPYFHEGPVLFDDALYFVTNRLGPDSNTNITWGQTSPPKDNQYIDIMKLELKSNTLSIIYTDPSILMANGMTKTADKQNILVLSQGKNTTGGGVYELDRTSLKVKPILTSFYGREFNSPNDVEITSDGVLFFSDPPYGYEQGFRSFQNPMLGSNVYRYDTSTKTQTIITTALQRPNGVALFDDRDNGNGCTLFLSDTGFVTVPYQKPHIQLPRGFDGFGDSALYTMKDKGDGCFATKDGPYSLQPLVPAIKGIQDGMEVHRTSELLLFCDGVGLWVWSIPLHKNIGLVKVQNCTQVMFSQKTGINDVFILAEKRLYEIPLNFGKISATSSASMFLPKTYLFAGLSFALIYLF